MAEAKRKRPTRARRNRALAPDDERRVNEIVQNLALRQEAQRRFLAAQPGDGYQFPRPGRTLAHDLAQPRQEVRYTIAGIHPSGGNSVLVAQYKAGKTTLLLNLMQALADEEPFLGQFDVEKLDGRVAYWNYELDDDMFRDWVRDVSVQNPDRVAEPLHLRGHNLALWLPDVAERAVRWLRKNEVRFLIVDPAAQAWRGLVENENDNTQIGDFTHALDAIKRRAGVRDLVLATHTGRAKHEVDEERARGATRLEDWMDAGWYLTKDSSGRRSLRASGRDVHVAAIDLSYDEGTRRVRFTGQTRDQRRENEGIQRVIDALAAWEDAGRNPPTTTQLEQAMEGDKNTRNAAIRAAVAAGVVAREPGPKRSQLHRLTDKGKERAARRVKTRTKRTRRRPRK